MRGERVLNCFYSSVSFEGSPWGQLAINNSEPKAASRLKHRYDARTQQDPSLSPTCTRAAPLTQRKLVPSLASTLTPQLTTDTTSPLTRIHAHYPTQVGGYIYHSPPPSSHNMRQGSGAPNALHRDLRMRQGSAPPEGIA